MSAKISGMVWDLPLEPREKYVLLAFADHADHLGRNVRPSVGLIAQKTGFGSRAIQKIVAGLRAQGYLVPVRFLTGGRGHVIEYRLALPPEPPRKGEPDDTLFAQGTPASTGEAASEAPPRKGEPADTLSPKGEPADTLSAERVNGETRKGEPADVKGEPRFTPTVRSQILNPPLSYLPPLGEGGNSDDALAVGEGSADAPCPPPDPPPPPPAKAAPWGKTMAPAVAACPICDWQGFLHVWDQAGVLWELRCCHDTARMDRICTSHGYTLGRPEPPEPDAPGTGGG